MALMISLLGIRGLMVGRAGGKRGSREYRHEIFNHIGMHLICRAAINDAVFFENLKAIPRHFFISQNRALLKLNQKDKENL